MTFLSKFVFGSFIKMLVQFDGDNPLEIVLLCLYHVTQIGPCFHQHRATISFLVLLYHHLFNLVRRWNGAAFPFPMPDNYGTEPKILPGPDIILRFTGKDYAQDSSDHNLLNQFKPYF